MVNEKLHNIILISDGEETCGGDPVAAARELVAKGFKLKIFTLGFNVNETARKQLEDLATQFGGSYTDIRGGEELAQAMSRIAQQTFLIEKKNEDGNRIRGGDTFETAVSLEIGKEYMLDHHQKMGEYDYFSIEAAPGQAIKAWVTSSPNCITVSGSQATESKCSPIKETFYMEVADPSRKAVISHKVHGVAETGKESTVYFVPSGDGTRGLFYVVVGSPNVDLHKDHKFSIMATEEQGDAGQSKDAGSSMAQALAIEPGIHENNHLSSGDMVDMFKVKGRKGTIVKVAVTPAKQNLSLRVTVMGSLGETLKAFSTINPTSFESKPLASDGDIFIKIEMGQGRVGQRENSYLLGVSVSDS